MIDKVKRREYRDEFDFPVHVDLPPPHVEYCCEKHHDSSVLTRRLYFEKKNEQNNAEIKATVIRIVEKTKTEVISREMLEIIVETMVKKNGHTIDREDRDMILDSCIMDGDVQVEREGWKDERERRERLGGIPVRNYDTIKFIERLIAFIDDKNIKVYT
jgi:hypothetical protein